MKKWTNFASYLAAQIDASEKTQREIASALGYARPNLITMFKQGLTKVPIEKVPALAKILGLDPVHLLTFAMREYMPETLKTIQANVGYVVTGNEYAVVEAIRGVTKDANPKFTREQLSKIKTALTH